MGVVWKGHDTVLDRQVAIKVLPPERLGDEERRHRFVREARTPAAVTHPYNASIHEIAHTGGLPFIVMDLTACVRIRGFRICCVASTTRTLLSASISRNRCIGKRAAGGRRALFA